MVSHEKGCCHMEWILRTIKGTGCMTAVNAYREPTVISHGTVEGMYDRHNPYLMVPVEICTVDSSQLAIAMLDTGANACFISDHLRNKMNLKPFAEDHVGNSRDIVKSGVYKVWLRLGDIKLEDVTTMEFSNSEFLGADLVIGMNVISLGEFHISKDGTFRLKI